jgi:membrane associated rhomboid family serine protease
MDTSGTAPWSISADLVLLVLFGFVAVQLLRTARRPLPVPWLTMATVVVIGVPSLLQFAVPGIGQALERDQAATLGDGQWWRPLTALLAQDGGVIAAAFNLIVVAAVVLVGEWTWGRVRTLVAFLGTSLVLNLAALAWTSHGGGSSFAADGLMVALTVHGALSRGTIPPLRVIAVGQVVLGVLLVVLNDAHGLAMLVGAAVGLLMLLPARTAGRMMDTSPTRKEPA